MKRLTFILLILAAALQTVPAQDDVRRLVERYDYKAAVKVIDSLMTGECPDSISLAIEKARCLRKMYRAEDAVQTLAEVLHLDQFNVELLAEMAESQTQAGNTEEAVTWYSLLSQLQPDNMYFKLCKARIMYREKQYQESIMSFKKIVATDTIPEILSMIGDGYRNLGQNDSALLYYDKVLAARPGHVPTISRKADILLASKQYDPVVEMTEKYLKEDPDNMTVLPIYGLALHLKEMYPQSIQAFEHQRDLGDDSYSVHYYIGLNHYMMNKWTKAAPELTKAYQKDSSDVRLVYQLAHARSHIHVNNELPAESERLYAKAIEMLQPDPSLMHNIYGSMAITRHRLEQFRDAIKYYELSYRYNKKNISALSAIAHCYERLKEYEKSLEYYEAYLKLAKPGSSGYNFAKESIDYIKQEKFMMEK